VQLLEDSALPAVQTYRDQYAIAEDLDKYYQHPVYTDKPTVLDSLSHLFRKPDTIGKTIEMWLYNPVQSGNQIVATTPDHRFLFQTCINGTQMSIDVLSLDSTVTGSVSVLAANHYTVDISTRPSLGGWQHVVLMSNDFVAGTMQAYVNGQLMPAVSGSPYAGCGLNIGPGGLASNTPDNFSTLKHLRLYSRLMDASEIYKNVHDPYFRPSNDVTMYWFRANIPEPGSVTTIGTLNTDEFLFKPVFPQHRMPTTYTYNSTNQVSKQQSPDGGINRFWYDLLSRLSISQNDKQLPGNDYSYTTYDVLGRISEVSQKKQTTIALGDPDYLADATLSSFAAAGTDSQITHTYYDVAAPATNGMQSVTQNNLRKRVASSTYRDTQAGQVQQATYYDYDLDGNVKTLYQQLAGLDLKRIDYEYDLVSGKVNFVSYQKNQPDQFYYSYNYDAENRLTEAWSSPLATLSSYSRGSTLNTTKRRMDASYKYYLHGPLARMELGDVSSKVQGVDYAYTLQGWLKGVNRSIFRFQPQLTTDMGNDGSNGVPKDAFNYNLYYYLNDYKPIGGTDPFEHELQEDPTFYPLYNGNIAGIGQTLPAINQPSMVNSYRYDQLNRLTVNQPRQNNLPYALPEYDTMDEFFSYDGNGNIKTAFRHGDFFAAKKEMDDLTYNYNRDAQGNLINNKLRHVNDALPYYGSNNPQDLHDQVADNYQYDAIGNLIVDQQGAISNIKWTVYGKIDSITKTDGPSIKYRYDPTGQRASKTVNGITTWYVRDAQGNTMAVYDNKSNQINWREQGLYGSSRLGLWEPNVNLANNNAATVWDTVGHKEYELANHLGNVLVTITDKRLPHSTDGTTIDYYEPEVRMAQEYFAFGAPIPKRNYFLNDKQYRYGFNGKENDNEVKLDWSGNPIAGSQQDYGMRIYDPRLGRFLSVDPLTRSYPMLTPYQFASNDPIESIDADGAERVDYKAIRQRDGTLKLQKIGESPTVEIDKSWWSPDVETPIPYHVRVEYNGRYYLFIANGPQSGLAHQNRPYASKYNSEGPFYYLSDFAKFKANPNAYTPVPEYDTPDEYDTFMKLEVLSAITESVSNVHAVSYSRGSSGRGGGQIKPPVSTIVDPEVLPPTEPYDRLIHYGRAPTAADRKFFGAQTGEDIDHLIPLVKHYYEGDGQGGIPGYLMPPQARKDFARNRSNMARETSSNNRSNGAKLTQYSIQMKKNYNLAPKIKKR
jgi:RHS repeat-associated protein